MGGVSAVIVGAGEGRRFGAPKQFMDLAGMPVLARAVAPFERCGAVDEIILVTKSDAVDFCRRAIVDANRFAKVAAVVPGGPRRQDSVAAGLARCSERADIVLIHDGARPFVTGADITRVIEGARAHRCCALAVPVKDTIKSADEHMDVTETLDRQRLWHIQTPQGFEAGVIRRAYADAGLDATDDCHQRCQGTDLLPGCRV